MLGTGHCSDTGSLDLEVCVTGSARNWQIRRLPPSPRPLRRRADSGVCHFSAQRAYPLHPLLAAPEPDVLADIPARAAVAIAKLAFFGVPAAVDERATEEHARVGHVDSAVADVLPFRDVAR
jgi:hypothetical protein